MRPDQLDLLRRRLRAGDPAAGVSPGELRVASWRQVLLSGPEERRRLPAKPLLAAAAISALLVGGLLILHLGGREQASEATTGPLVAANPDRTRTEVPPAEGTVSIATTTTAGPERQHRDDLEGTARHNPEPSRGTGDSLPPTDPPVAQVAVFRTDPTNPPPTQVQITAAGGTRIIWLLQQQPATL